MNIISNIILILLVLACNLLMYGFGYVHGRKDGIKLIKECIDEIIEDEQRNSKQDS